jgi:hypothetical protein
MVQGKIREAIVEYFWIGKQKVASFPKFRKNIKETTAIAIMTDGKPWIRRLAINQ